MNNGPVYALIAALLFGASTPFAKLLLGEIDPWLLAGLLYGGSAIGLGAILLLKSLKATGEAFYLPRKDVLWLSCATLFGGILGPVFLMYGLSKTPASNASLLLNLEGVFTAVLAWFAFKEHFDRRVLLGMFLIVIGGVILTFPSSGFEASTLMGPILVIASCFCWGLDNNFTRKVSASDALKITFFKSVVAGGTNLILAFAIGVQVPKAAFGSSALALGFLGYGLSIVMFVLALRNLGASRTGAYFSTAPFIGSLISIAIFPASLSPNMIIAGLFMAVGVWLHLTENHAHEHTHEELEHEHPHSHDAHHLHEHLERVEAVDGHSHRHIHKPMKHSHPHFPDIHHQHSH